MDATNTSDTVNNLNSVKHFKLGGKRKQLTDPIFKSFQQTTRRRQPLDTSAFDNSSKITLGFGYSDGRTLYNFDLFQQLFSDASGRYFYTIAR